MAGKHLWYTKVTANDEAARERLGIVRTEYDTTHKGFKSYVYVRNGSVAIGSGSVVYYVDSGTSVSANAVGIVDSREDLTAGVAVTSVTASYYCWIQTFGYHPTIFVNDDDDGANGDSIIIDSDGNGICDCVSAGATGHGTTVILGVAVAAVTAASNTIAGLIRIGPSGGV